MPKWVLIPRFSSLSGYSEKAIQRKREAGVWLENVHWKKAPDGRIFINIEQVDKWVENGSMRLLHAA